MYGAEENKSREDKSNSSVKVQSNALCHAKTSEKEEKIPETKFESIRRNGQGAKSIKQRTITRGTQRN